MSSSDASEPPPARSQSTGAEGEELPSLVAAGAGCSVLEPEDEDDVDEEERGVSSVRVVTAPGEAGVLVDVAGVDVAGVDVAGVDGVELEEPVRFVGRELVTLGVPGTKSTSGMSCPTGIGSPISMGSSSAFCSAMESGAVPGRIKNHMPSAPREKSNAPASPKMT